jgi:hypothetical protein
MLLEPLADARAAASAGRDLHKEVHHFETTVPETMEELLHEQSQSQFLQLAAASASSPNAAAGRIYYIRMDGYVVSDTAASGFGLDKRRFAVTRGLHFTVDGPTVQAAHATVQVPVPAANPTHMRGGRLVPK